MRYVYVYVWMVEDARLVWTLPWPRRPVTCFRSVLIMCFGVAFDFDNKDFPSQHMNNPAPHLKPHQTIKDC